MRPHSPEKLSDTEAQYFFRSSGQFASSWSSKRQWSVTSLDLLSHNDLKGERFQALKPSGRCVMTTAKK